MKDKPGILFTVPVGFTGGAELCLLAIIDCLDQEKVQPIVVCGFGEQLPGSLKKGNIIHYTRIIEPRQPLNYLSNTLFLNKIIKRHIIKLIHANAIRSSIASAAAAKMNRLPFIADIQDMIEYNFAKRWLINRADVMLVHSKAVKKWMLDKGFPESKLKVVYMGIADDWFHPAEPVKQLKRDLPIIGFIGQIAEIKGLPVLLKALKIVSYRFPDFKAVLVGGDFNHKGAYLEEMKALANMLGISDKAQFMGFQDNPRNWTASFDIMVVPSLVEPLGMVAMEGLAQKKPVISSNTGGLPEIIQDGITGLVVEPGLETALAEAILKLLHNPQYGKKLAQAGYEQTKTRFHINVMMRNFNAVYKELMGMDVMREEYLK